MGEYRIPSTTLSSGVAFGPIVIIGNGEAVSEEIGLSEAERKTQNGILAQAIELSVQELKDTAIRVEAALGKDKAEIFESHAEILEDREFQDDFFSLIRDEGYCASYAVKTGCEKHASEMEELDDEYFRGRADDFRDIGRRVISKIGSLAPNTHYP